MDGWIDKDGYKDGRMNGWMDGQMDKDGYKDVWMDVTIYPPNFLLASNYQTQK